MKDHLMPSVRKAFVEFAIGDGPNEAIIREGADRFRACTVTLVENIGRIGMSSPR
jgi:hypothetical protein